MTIRDAAERDLPAIVDIYNAAIATRISTALEDPVGVEDRSAWFHAHSADAYPLWVAETDATVAGWLSFHPFIGRSAYRSTAEISLYVHENFRRRGFGDQLLKKAIAECSRLKISALVGCIFGHNGPSLRLFERMGFERWGFLPRIARLDRVERDLVILGRHIQASA